MSITIKLSVHVPDGTRVEITLPEKVSEKENVPGWMKEFADCINTLPPDATERHTDYAHGRKRRL